MRPRSLLGLAAQSMLFAGLAGSYKNEVPSKFGEPAFRPYTDRIGMPHGRSGDKLVRKAMRGIIGVHGSRRGPLGSMKHAPRFPFSATKR